MNNLLVTFIILNILNVVIQTAKSLITIKGNKGQAAIANAIAYGFYTIVIIYMVCDLPLLQKVVIVGLCNLVGVYAVKMFEESRKKDKLWKVEVTIPANEKEKLIAESAFYDLSFNYVDIGKYCIFNFYCEKQEDSKKVRELLKFYKAKYFVSESKIL